MVATLATAAPGRTQPAPRARRSLRMIQGSLSARRIERRSPMLAGLHRIASGVLAGLGVSVLGLSALTLHGQGQWARSYAQLESTKNLEHRLQEATAVLERHHLGTVARPGRLVPTSSERLIHLPEPEETPDPGAGSLFAGLHTGAMPSGY